ncbi:hypothetical protein R3P38DRAFT_2384544, partial [Favolaschia claudopus]
KAKSDRVKDRELAQLREKYMQRAIRIWRDSREGPGTSTQEALSLNKACRMAEAECLAEKKKIVTLSTSSLDRRIKGGRSTHEAHADQKWLSPEEERVVINYAIDCANRGFPVSH